MVDAETFTAMKAAHDTLLMKDLTQTRGYKLLRGAIDKAEGEYLELFKIHSVKGYHQQEAQAHD